MCDWDSEGPRAYQETIRVARKAHGCCACAEVIRPGDRYQYASGIWDGPSSFKRCLRCVAIFEELVARNDGLVDMELDCGESFRDVYGFDPPEDLSSLAFVTRDEMQERIK